MSTILNENDLGIIDTLDQLVDKTIYMLTAQISFMLWVAKQNYTPSENENMGMDTLHRGLIEEFNAILERLTKEDIKGVFVDTLDSHIANVEYTLNANLCFFEYVIDNDLGISQREEAGLFFSMNGIEAILTSYTKELTAHLRKA